MPVVLSAMLAGGSACYTYQPVRIADVPSGTAIRARLTPNEAARIGEILNTEGRYIEGELLERTASGEVVLKVTSGSNQHPGMMAVTHQNVTVAADAIQEVESRRLDTRRTSVVAGVGAAALAVIVRGALAAQKQPEPGPPKGGTDALRWPEAP